MDVSFTNVLEGARQYFQGLPPAATSSSASPAYPITSSENAHRTEVESNGELPPSSQPPPHSSSTATYWATPAEGGRPPTRDQTPIQRPPSHHSDATRPPSHSQSTYNNNNANNHYQQSYQDTQQQQQQQQQMQYQFPRPHSRETSSQNYQPNYHNQNANMSYHHQQQPPRAPSRPEQIVTMPNTSQTYHQLQNSIQTSQAYTYQQQRSYYGVPNGKQLPPSSQQHVIPSNDPYKTVSSQSNNQDIYYKHLYMPQTQSSSSPSTSSSSTVQMTMPYMNSKSSYTHLSYENNKGLSDQHQVAVSSQNNYRTTHNLPPIAALSVNYPARTNRQDVNVKYKPMQKQLPPNVVTNNYQNMVKSNMNSSPQVQQQRISYSNEMTHSHDYRAPVSHYNTHPNRSMAQNFNQYITTTTTTVGHGYTPVVTNTIVTSSYTTPVQTTTLNHQQQQYYMNKSTVPQDVVVRNSQPMPAAVSSNHDVNVTGQTMGDNGRTSTLQPRTKRESPLDLSVKTVKTSADSTDDSERDTRSKQYIRTTSAGGASNPAHGYPTYDVYASSFQRNMTPRSNQQSNAGAPKVEFHPNFNVGTLSNDYRHDYRKTHEKNGQRQMTTPNRYPTVSVPSAAHVNSYIQTNQPMQKRPMTDNLPRIDFPPHGHGHKTTASYPTPMHDMQRKRQADTAPTIVPNKIPKVNDMWRKTIDEQIEQRFSTYKQQQQKYNNANTITNNNNNNNNNVAIGKSLVNGNYQGQDRAKEPTSLGSYATYQPRPAYHNTTAVPQHQAYPASTHYSHSQSHNQTYVPTAMAHHYPAGYSYPSSQQHQPNPVAYPQHPRNNVSPVKSNLGGADKRVLSLLRNSLEIKGAKEAQRKLEKEQLKAHDAFHRPDIQHPSTDVTAPLQPKPGIIGRHNVSPFTPMNFPEGNSNIATLYKLHLPKAIDSVSFETDVTMGKTVAEKHNNIEDSQALITNHVNSSAADLDGLAAFLAARIRTKAELKQVGTTQQQQANNDARQDKYEGETATSTPPKLMKEKQQNYQPRRRLFSRSEDDSGNNSNVPHRDKSGLRSSSETSVFDFPDSDSECEMPVLERQTLEDMRRDRKSCSKTIGGSSSSVELKAESDKSLTSDDDFFTQTCDNFVEQLKKNGTGKKRGRRKKGLEADVLAKLESVTKENRLETKALNEDDESIVANREKINVKVDDQDDDDSDVPLINCKVKLLERAHKIKQESLDDSNKKVECEKSTAFSDSSDDEVEIINNESQKRTINVEKQNEKLNKKGNNSTPIIIGRPGRKPNFGDGSDFYPGWEEEVYRYKKSLRMPTTLIHVTRPPHYHRLSTSLPDLDPVPYSPSPLLSIDDYTRRPAKIKTEPIDSDDESTCSSNLQITKKCYDSEGGNAFIKRTTKENFSILDRLLAKYGSKEKRKYRKKDGSNISSKIVPKTEGKDDADDSFELTTNATEDRLEIKKESMRTNKQKATIKEVFGEDRPASAPPVTCVNDIKLDLHIKKETDDGDRGGLLASTKQALKNRLLSRGRAKKNLLKTLVDKKIKSELGDEQLAEDEDDDEPIKPDPDCKSGTPSIDGDDGSVSGKKRSKLRNIRRKFSSGFDYLRKKKKQSKKDGNGGDCDTTVRPKRRGPLAKSNPESIQDIQKEIKTWVLNKGIGETHLHRSARLGYTDIAAYCLEKMECTPSPKDNAGYTPLHEASARGHLDIARLLLLYGANVSESARGGVRPLHEAVENGYVEIVRLLLSYGADPMLATYNGSTPLGLANDDLTRQLLQEHINDIQGKIELAWTFPGPASCFDPDENGFNMFDDTPEPDPPSDEEDIEFELSDALLPNLYTLRGEPQTDRWILLQDLSNLLKIKSRDALLRQISSPAITTPSVVPTTATTTVGTYKNVLRELKMSDFLEQAHCCQFLNIGEKVNTRASKIALVKYTDKVKELLNIERVVVTR